MIEFNGGRKSWAVATTATAALCLFLAGCGFSLLRSPDFNRMPAERFGSLDLSATGPRLLRNTMAGGRASVAGEADGRDCAVYAEPVPDFVLTVPEGAGTLRFTVLGSVVAKVVVVGPDGALRCSAPPKKLGAPEVVVADAAAGRYLVWTGMPGHLVLKPVQLFVERLAQK